MTRNTGAPDNSFRFPVPRAWLASLSSLIFLHHLPPRRQNHLVPPLLQQALALLLALRPARRGRSLRRRGLGGAVLGLEFRAEIVAGDQVLGIGLGGRRLSRL